MSSELHGSQRRIWRFLLVHLLIVIIVPALFPVMGNMWDYVITVVLTALVLALLDRRYGRYLFWTTLFVVYLIKEIIASNFVLAWIIIQPKSKLDPGIIAVPLTVTTGLEITVLSLAISATPGTLVVELLKDAADRPVLFVHTLNVGDPDRFRATIKDGFERMILHISRGATA